MNTLNSPALEYDVFLSYSHEDAEWVKGLATRLSDERGFTVWFDEWALVPGESWQAGMARGMDQSKTFAVCIGKQTTEGWVREEVERALDQRTVREGFRVLAVILPDASSDYVPPFLSEKTWVDFRKDPAYSFHKLSQGIKGEPVGRWPIEGPTTTDTLDPYAQKLQKLQKYREIGLAKKVYEETQSKLMDKWIESL